MFGKKAEKANQDQFNVKSTAPIATDKIVVTEVPKVGAYATHPDLPGAFVFVKLELTTYSSPTSTAGTDIRHVCGEARELFMRRHCKAVEGIRVASRRRTQVLGRDLRPGLARFQFDRVVMVGWPEVYEHRKTGRQVVFTWDDADVVPDFALEDFANALGLTLKELEDAIGLTAAREVVDGQADAIAAVRAKRAEDEKRAAALAEAAHAKKVAKEAQDRATEAQRVSDSLAAKVAAT